MRRARSSSSRAALSAVIALCSAACASPRGSASPAQGEPTLHYVGTEVSAGWEYDVLELRNDSERTWTYLAFDSDAPLFGCMSLWRNGEWQPWCDAARCAPMCLTGARTWRLEAGERRLIRQTSSGQPSIAEVWLRSEDGSVASQVASEPYVPPERVVDGVSNRARELRTIPRRELDDPLSRIDWCRLLVTRE